MSVELPLPGLVDIRQPILGDSFGWDGTEPTAAKKSVVFHHSASDQVAEDGFSIADYHVNGPNQWGGIGYHFVITRRDYPGRANFCPPGAQIQYVGDLGTWRAHCLRQNPGRVGVCFVGFEPDEEQLKLGRQLMEFLVAPNNILPSINFLNQATVHQLVPEQSTACPGTTFPTWLPYLQGGAWPYNPPVPTPPPAPALPDPPLAAAPETPAPSDMTPGKGGGLPNGVLNWREDPSKRPIAREGANGIDITTGAVVVPNIATGTVIDVAGYFDFNGRTYARTVYSVAHDKWNGLDTVYFDAPTGQVPDAQIPVTVTPPDQVQANVTDEQLQAATVPEPSKPTLIALIIEWIARITAAYIAKRKS